MVFTKGGKPSIKFLETEDLKHLQKVPGHAN